MVMGTNCCKLSHSQGVLTEDHFQRFHSETLEIALPNGWHRLFQKKNFALVAKFYFTLNKKLLYSPVSLNSSSRRDGRSRGDISLLHAWVNGWPLSCENTLRDLLGVDTYFLSQMGEIIWHMVIITKQGRLWLLPSAGNLAVVPSWSRGR